MFDTVPTARDLRRAAMVQLGLAVVFGAGSFWARDGLRPEFPPWWVVLLLLIAVVAGLVLAERVPYRAEPIDPALGGERAREAAMTAFGDQIVRRLLYTGVPVGLVIAAAYVFDHGGWPILLVGPVALAVMVFETWPSLRTVTLSAVILESAGAQTGLVEEFIAP